MENKKEIVNFDIKLPKANVIFLLDVSGSMMGERINCLNEAMEKALSELKERSIKTGENIYVRVIKFSTYVEWVIGDEKNGVYIHDIHSWKKLKAGGTTNTADAINECTKALKLEHMTIGDKKPVVILFTDGASLDSYATKLAIDKLKTVYGENFEKKIIRIAIGIDDYDKKELEYFASIGNYYTCNGAYENVPLVLNTDNPYEIAKNVVGAVSSDIFRSIPCSYCETDESNVDDDIPVVVEVIPNSTEEW